MMNIGCTKKGEVEFGTSFDVDKRTHRVNMSIAPDKITNDQFFMLHSLVIPRRITASYHDDPAANIIDYFPRQDVSEIKRVADCNMTSYGFKAMLDYGDIVMLGLKNVEKNIEEAAKYYQMSASFGYTEAHVAVAMLFHERLTQRSPAHEEAILLSKHMVEIEDYQIQQQIFISMEKAAQAKYLCPALVGLMMTIPYGIQLPPALQALHNHFKPHYIEVKKDESITNPHGYRCSTGSCYSYVTDASLFLHCHRCKFAKYCSRQCQSEDWRTHSINCTELPVKERESNLGTIIAYQEPETEDSIVDTPPTIANNLENNSRQESDQSILSSIRLPNMPDATFDELVAQAEVYITSTSYSQAIKCFTYALLKNDMEGEIVMTERTHRIKLANTIARKIWCQVQGEEGQEQHDMCRLKLLREDCAFLLDTGIFDLNELGSELAQKVNVMDIQAKVWVDELAVDEWIPQTMLTAQRRRQQTQNNRSRKKKSKKKSKVPAPPPFQLHPCVDLVEHTEVKNAGSEQDYCPSCQTQWNHFIEPCYAVVLPCLHAMCCTCLIKFQNGCKQTFETEIDDNVQVTFVCPLCREKLNANLSFEMAKVMIAKEDAIPTYDVFMRTVHFEDSRAADTMILHLLEQYEFQLSLVGDVLFNMIGLLVNDDIANQVELIHDEKQDIYETARAPVRVLEDEIKKVQNRYNAHWKATNQEKRKFLQTIKCFKKRLVKARENAANDIYERMNASGNMGTLSGNTLLKIDIHGLHVEEAKSQITEYVLPVLHVVSKVIVITGRGRHGASGASILKPAMEDFLHSVNINFKDVPGNDGAIWIYS